MQIQLAAANVLRLVVDNKLSLDDALDRYFPQVGENRPQLQELCYGTCRYYFFFDNIIHQLLKKPIKSKDRTIHFLLVGALYQINHMRTPDHAAVNQCVKALGKTQQSWAKALVNGVLRNYLRDKDAFSNGASTLAHKHAFPAFFIDRFNASWPEHVEQIATASNVRPPMTLRVNQGIGSRESYAQKLTLNEIPYSLTRDSDLGITLDKPRAVEEIPGFMDGEVSVQDESAQLAATALLLQSGQRVLDGCAAPGGKTCAILETEPDLETVVAVDFAKRISGIEQNLQRLKLTAELISDDLTHYDSWWDGAPFDRILLDVPCSGSGVIRRHPDIKHRRESDDFPRFAEKQLEIISAAWQMLADHGKLVYVTCSVLKEENDGVIANFLAAQFDAEIEPLGDQFGLETQFGRQRLPGVHSGDGFYYCRIAKRCQPEVVN